MSTNELLALLGSLPDEKAREYELSLTSLSARIKDAFSEQMLLDILESTCPEQTRYNAFYCLNICYRRQKDFPKLKDLLDRYRDRFDIHITFDHLEALYDIESDTIYDYADLIRKTYKSAQLLSDNAGFVHLFADVFATIYEKGGLHNKDEYLQKWYEPALTAVNRALELDPSYAKYYCTKARILRIKGDFAQANFNVDLAIGLENSSRPDYPLRITGYQYHKMMIYTEARLKELEQQLTEKYDACLRQSLSGDPHAGVCRETPPQAYKGKKPFVFVSYSHKNAARVYAIVRRLQKEGVRIWLDVDIPLGEDYYEHIATQIVNCRVFMPMISANAVNAEFVRKEIGLADRHAKPFFSIFLEDIPLSHGMDLLLNSFQRVNWYNGADEQNIEQLLHYLPPDIFDRDDA